MKNYDFGNFVKSEKLSSLDVEVTNTLSIHELERVLLDYEENRFITEIKHTFVSDGLRMVPLFTILATKRE